ncbi:recombinase family protein [Staphylococcus pettenkoferi]|uniref:recombinase family protein n=1 Tax=Staphylococcus pettenkoferi TaxID=170573 RepID=UPI0011A8CA8F|nr:recombinase family protein [Staphylococcus pettenkoferi]
MKFGYARVSTEEQHLENQINWLIEQGVDRKNIFVDEISGTTSPYERDGFKSLLNAKIRQGDDLYVFKLDRLGRKANVVEEMVRELLNDGIILHSKDLPDIPANDKYGMGKLLLNVMLSVLTFQAETERLYMLERQRVGIERAKKEGRYKGKKVKYSKDSDNLQGRVIYEKVVEVLKNGGTIRGTAKKYGLGMKTVQRIKNEIKRESE